MVRYVMALVLGLALCGGALASDRGGDPRRMNDRGRDHDRFDRRDRDDRDRRRDFDRREFERREHERRERLRFWEYRHYWWYRFM